MKKLILLVLVVFVAGCGDPNYVEPTAQPSEINYSEETAAKNAERTLQIASGGLVPSPEDFIALDVAPIIEGVSSPDGMINTGDSVVWLILVEEARTSASGLSVLKVHRRIGSVSSESL